MMIYKKIASSFWTDPDNCKLRPLERYLFLYFITCPHSHYSGIYYVPWSAILDETGLQGDAIKKLITNMAKQIKYDYDYKIVWVVNMAYHQLGNVKDISKDNRIQGIANHLSSLHKCPLINEFLSHYKAWNIPFSPVKVSKKQEPKTEHQYPEVIMRGLSILKTIPNYPYDEAKDSDLLIDKGKQFPKIDIIQLLSSWKTYIKDHPFNGKARPRVQLDNRFNLAMKWKKWFKVTEDGEIPDEADMIGIIERESKK